MLQDTESNQIQDNLVKDDSLFAFSPYYDNINQVLNEQYALLQLGEWQYQYLDLSQSSKSSENKQHSASEERAGQQRHESKLVIEGVSAILNDHKKRNFFRQHLFSQELLMESSQQNIFDHDLYQSQYQQQQVKRRQLQTHCAKFSTLQPRCFEIMPPSPAILSVPTTSVLLHSLQQCNQENKVVNNSITCTESLQQGFHKVDNSKNVVQALRQDCQLHLCQEKVYKMRNDTNINLYEYQQNNDKINQNDVICDNYDLKGNNNINFTAQNNFVQRFSKNKYNSTCPENASNAHKLNVSERKNNTENKHITDDDNNDKYNNKLDNEDLLSRVSKYANEKSFVHVYDPQFRYMFEVPVAAIRHLPPARLNITRLVLCRNYRAPNTLHAINDTTGSNNTGYNGQTMLNEGSNTITKNVPLTSVTATNSLQFGCQMGSSCKFVHADCDYSTLVRHSIHVNYIWRSPQLCIYPRLVSGNSVKVFDIQQCQQIHKLSPQLLLQTKGSLSWTEAACPLHCCTDYEVNGMCTSGESCIYAHRLLVDPNSSTTFRRAPKKSKLIKVQQRSSTSRNNNNQCKLQIHHNKPSSVFQQQAPEGKQNRQTLQHIHVNTTLRNSFKVSNVLTTCNRRVKRLMFDNNKKDMNKNQNANSRCVFTIMETDQAKRALQDMSSIGTLLLLPTNSTQALVLGSIQRGD